MSTSIWQQFYNSICISFTQVYWEWHFCISRAGSYVQKSLCNCLSKLYAKWHSLVLAKLWSSIQGHIFDEKASLYTWTWWQFVFENLHSQRYIIWVSRHRYILLWRESSETVSLLLNRKNIILQRGRGGWGIKPIESKRRAIEERRRNSNFIMWTSNYVKM